MSIPPFTNDGLLPPFLGSEPGMASSLMSPYAATAIEIVEAFGTDANRLDILRKWLAHRAALRQIGFAHGFQWLDGSFVENKSPNDLDVVTFLYAGPPSFATAADAQAALVGSIALFQREPVKRDFRLDFLVVDLLDDPELLVDVSRYWFGLFSHQRVTMNWKGILQTRMDDANGDIAAGEFLEQIALELPELEPAPAENLSLFGERGA